MNNKLNYNLILGIQ